MSKSTETMEKIVALCRRRGFIFGSSEIYGGIGGFWDYGPLGVELKRNIKDCWWHDMVRNPPPGPDGRKFQMVGVDCSIIMNPKVWEASGHVGGFADPMVDCKECNARFRADQVYSLFLLKGPSIEHLRDAVEYNASHPKDHLKPEIEVFACSVEANSVTETLDVAGDVVRAASKARNIGKYKKFTPETKLRGVSSRSGTLFCTTEAGEDIQVHVEALATDDSATARPCPKCHAEDSLTESREFNLMFETNTGALQDSTSKVYLRPETAQGIFVNFKNVMDTTRVKIPFGIAQIGKAFRNEINPRNYTFRSREFEQMEIEFFCNPNESKMWYEFWRDVRIKWYESLGIQSDKLRPREQGEDELAHYSDACTDIEYMFPFADEPQELEGVAHRGSFDLMAHGKASKGKETAFAVLDDATKERFVPHVIEPSAGVDRFTLATITEAYSFDENRASPEFMKFHPRLAPIKAGVFPLVAKDGLPELAEPIYADIRKHFSCQYDAKQSIGKRYARMDEAGTPFCFTIDHETKEQGTVTVRNRDDASQEKIDKSRCLEYLRDKLGL